MIEILASALLLIGTLFVALGAVGLLRLPDVYSRMHAVTKATTLGMAGILGASGVVFASAGQPIFGEILTLWLVFMTNPLGGHMIAKSAYLVGVRMAEISVVDEFGRHGAAGAAGAADHDRD